MLVHVRFSQLEEQEEIAEFEELVRSADIEQLAILIARRKRPDARLFIGSGKLEELRALLTALPSSCRIRGPKVLKIRTIRTSSRWERW